MNRIKYDMALMGYISLFEKITHSKLKDCFELNDKLIFIVQKGEIGKAIGKQAVNVKKLESMFKKKVRLIEFNEDKIEFVKNIIYPVKAKLIEENENIITITSMDNHTRGILIGKAAEALRSNEKIIQRYFEIKEIKVI